MMATAAITTTAAAAAAGNAATTGVLPAAYGGDEISALVIDVGTTLTKAGYAGEDTPKAVFGTDVGVIEQQDGSASNSSNGSAATARRVLVGDAAVWSRRDHMEIAHPLRNGLIHDFDLMEHLWDHAFSARLRVNLKEHPVLCSEPSFNTRDIREKMTEIFFEKYEVPGFFLCKDAVLSAFSYGRSTGLVLDIGGGKTTATPVYDGYVLRKGIIRQGIAGDFLTDQTQFLLEQMLGAQIVPQYLIASRNPVEADQPADFKLHSLPNTTQSFHQFSVKRVVADFKESVCQTSDTAYNEKVLQNLPMKPYEFPNGYNTTYGVERFQIPEILFSPSSTLKHIYRESAVPQDVASISENAKGVHQMIYDSVNMCDADYRANLIGSTLLTGGSSLFQSFTERLADELGKIAPSYRLKIYAPNNFVERRYSAWVGGSILASLGTFHQMWMSKQEYEETGRSLVEKKCP